MSRVDLVLQKLLTLPDVSIQKLDENPWQKAFVAKLLSSPDTSLQRLDEDPLEKQPSFEKWLGLPDTAIQIQDDDPLRLWLRMEENAEKLVGLAREFVDALDAEGGSGTLRQCAQRFISLTEANSSVNNPRKKAYQRIMKAFRQASPDVEAKRLKVSQLNMGTGSGSCSDKYIARSDVEDYLAGTGALVWDPHRCYKFCRHLADITGDGEFAGLAGELQNCLKIIDTFHLWGCFLLLASHDAVLPTANPRRYLALCFVLKHWREPALALKEAAKHIADAWRTEKEQRGGQAEASDSGTEDKGIDSDVPEAGDAKKRFKSKLRVVENILIKPAYQSLQLITKGNDPLHIDGKPLFVLIRFACRIANDASGETVPLRELNEAVGKEDEPDRATNDLKNAIKQLNRALSALGCPRDEKHFILNDRRKGYYLNTHCKWKIDEAIREEYAQSDRRSTDPQVMAETEVDKKYKPPGTDENDRKHNRLPAKRRGFKRSDDD